MQTTVQFLNGLDTIGGNVVSFVNGTTRLVMDLGINFNPEQQANADGYAIGYFPKLPTLFTDQQADELQTFVFISHLHIDHMGALSYLKQNTLVYMSQASYDLYQVLLTLGLEKPTVANIKVLESEVAMSFGPFTVTGYVTDHDIQGAMMFKISDGTHIFVHSGDVRWDGDQADLVTHWVHALQNETVDLLLMEGTEFSFPKSQNLQRNTEMQLQQQFQQKMLQTDQLIVINPYERNVHRLVALYNSAQAAGRQMVWEPEYGQILKKMDSFAGLVLGSDISWQMIKETPQRFVVQNRFHNLAQLSQLRAPFIYLHMNGEPLGRYDERFSQMEHFLQEQQGTLIELGASGHATRTDLTKIAHLVNAKVTVPWHTFKPNLMADQLRKVGLTVKQPEKNETLNFE